MLLIDGFCSTLDSAEWEIIVSALIRLWLVVLVYVVIVKKAWLSWLRLSWLTQVGWQFSDLAISMTLATLMTLVISSNSVYHQGQYITL